jgi:hypothetical protein
MDKEHLLLCPKLDTNQQVLKNTIKLYWKARAMITSPSSAIGTTTSVSLLAVYNRTTLHCLAGSVILQRGKYCTFKVVVQH